jgi:integrase
MPNISEKIVAALPTPERGNKLHYFSGATLQGKKAPSGFAVRVTAAGTKSFVLFHRQNGKGFLETLGRWDENEQGGSLTVRDAIIEADKRIKAIAKGGVDHRPERTRRLQDGNQPGGLTAGRMLDNWLARYVRNEAKLRSADEIARVLERLVKPEIGNLGIYEVRRSHVVAMLDTIADENGQRMADLTLAYVRKAFNWHETRDDEFRSPIIRGMTRVKASDQARDRILSDDELRQLWSALDQMKEPACFAPFVKTILLTAARRSEVADMQASEIVADVWTIPAARYKTERDHVVPLTPAAMMLIGNRPGYVFSTTAGEKPFSGFSKSKRELDAKLAGMDPWTFHDLRRTARSLMSRAGVNADHAERCLGHVIAGVRGVYDRHEYLDEKRAAFEALAALVDRILNPTDNVTELRQATIHSRGVG